MIYHLYALFDPAFPSDYRYVGWAFDICARLQAHINEAKRLSHTHKLHWIRKVLSEGKCPQTIAIGAARSRSDIGLLERAVIAQYRAAGVKLTNGTGGGEGMLNRRPSDAELAKMGASQRRRYQRPSERAHASKMARKRLATEDGKARHVAAIASPSSIAKKSLSMQAKWRDPIFRADHNRALCDPNVRARRKAANAASAPARGAKMKGRKLPPETCAKISAHLRDAWARGLFDFHRSAIK